MFTGDVKNTFLSANTHNFLLCTYWSQCLSFSFTVLSLCLTQECWYHLTTQTQRTDSVQYLLQHSCCYKSREETMAGVIRKTRLWMQREQGGKIQEVLIQVRRLRDRWSERCRRLNDTGQREIHIWSRINAWNAWSSQRVTGKSEKRLVLSLYCYSLVWWYILGVSD